MLNKKKKWIIIIASLILLALVIWIVLKNRAEDENLISTQVQKGTFVINVTTTGELEAKNSENIYGPDNLRNVRIWQYKISNIIPEGTVVDSGDFVATIDKTEILDKLKEAEIELEKIKSQYIKTKLDTALELRQVRDNLINLKYELEEKEIVLKQSKFEPPATIRQAEISLDKSKRAYEQAKRNYEIKLEQSIAKMKEVSAILDQEQRKFDNLLNVMDDFTINAPKSGMVIYERDWNGNKIKTGSQVNTWSNVVAILPDLTRMNSKTYVNEIDVSKVEKGQLVQVGVDAFPDKKYTGTVKEVANIGQKLPGSDTKVFEVMISLDQSDTILRPSMTTKNVILIAEYKDVVYVPIECVRGNDSISYVFTSKGKRKQVILGQSNENQVIIEKGLSGDEEIYLNFPENEEDWPIVFIKNMDVIETKKHDQDTVVTNKSTGKK